uniref:Uncharacterized protein n=1 Tax=Avena sativa TaxID=4498 RepID=A0ACD5Z9E2_AVESA
MSGDGGVEMTGRRGLSAAPTEDEDLVGEILVRLSPLPSSLPRASVSKLWKRIATAPGFHRRFLAHHRKPPILGIFEKCGGELVFTSVLDPPDRIPRERFSLRLGREKLYEAFDSWNLLGCRHGRVLITSSYEPVLLVFDAISGDRHYVSAPPDLSHCMCNVRGAVLCCADDQDHVHGDCHSSPFKVVLVGTRSHEEPAMAWVYSSETEIWGHPVSTAEPCTSRVSRFPCTLIGSALYWWLNESQDGMLEFDLDNHRLAVVKKPTFAGIGSNCIRIIRAEGGGVGMAVLSYPNFQLWDRKVSSDGVSTWVVQKTVNMHEIIGLPSGVETRNEGIVGYSEEADAVFISVSSNKKHHAFIVHLESMHSRKLNQRFLEHSYHPFANFYTPGTVEA